MNFHTYLLVHWEQNCFYHSALLCMCSNFLETLMLGQGKNQPNTVSLKFDWGANGWLEPSSAVFICIIYNCMWHYMIITVCWQSWEGMNEVRVSLKCAGISPCHVRYLWGCSDLKVCITPVGTKQDDVRVLWEMCDLRLFQAILLVNVEVLCLFSGNVSIVLSNDYSDICYVHFCNSLSSGNRVIK